MPFPRRHPTGLIAVWTLLAAFGVLACSGVPAARAAPPPEVRWIEVGPTAGSRWFADRLALPAAFAVGARIGLGVSGRVAVFLDGAHAEPARRTTGAPASVGDIRCLATYRLLSGRVRPYLLAGIGGHFFNFHDASGSAGLVVAGGLGAEALPGNGRWVVRVESAADVYGAEFVTYSNAGTTLASDEGTFATGTFSVGLGYRF